MNHHFFSILLLTYNSPWEKTMQTLYSILIQENVDYEIIIADDGSSDNNFNRIEEYLSSYSFVNYTLVENKKNQGTVKNFLSGLQHCQGEYIKPISPGDFLYDKNVLSSVYEIIQDKEAAVYFGKAIFYSYFDKKIHFFKDKANPRDLTPYLKKDCKGIKKNYLVEHDYILGASTFYKRDVFEKYFIDIIDIVKYTEDCIMIYMIANGETIEFLNLDCVIWYEYSSGISTSGDSKWVQRILADHKNIFAMLVSKKLIPKWSYNMFYDSSRIKRFFLKIFYNPSSIIKRLFFVNKIKGWKAFNNNIDILKNILNI